jgi:hypothetical protein
MRAVGRRTQQCLLIVTLVHLCVVASGEKADGVEYESLPVIRERVSAAVFDTKTFTETRSEMELIDKDPFLPRAAKEIRQVSVPDIKPVVPASEMPADLRSVAESDKFGKFTSLQSKLLLKNGFVVTPTMLPRPFYIYEKNFYYNLPSFITTDSVLHTYHLIFDYILRKLERRRLYGLTLILTEKMRQRSIDAFEGAREEKLKVAARGNIAYFEIALALLTGKRDGIHPEVEEMVRKELELVDRAEGRAESNVFPFFLDYSQFIPRGHYTRSEDWKNFFRGMMWYGHVPFPFYSQETGERLDDQILQAQLITLQLFNSQIEEERAIDIWTTIFEVGQLFSAESNTLTPVDYKNLMHEVYGPEVGLSKLTAEAKLQEFAEKGKSLKEMKVRHVLVGIPTGMQFRFMGLRAVPDTQIMQHLVEWPKRRFAGGLDVMAGVGFERAERVLIDHYREGEKWEEYPVRLAEMKEKFQGLEQNDWESSLYWGWLWVIQALAETGGDGHPYFTNTEAWKDKNLNAACGSWAELRHATILYAEPFGAEGSYGDTCALPRGYVEPNVVFYERMLWLASKTEAELLKYGLLTQNTADKLTQFTQVVEQLRTIAIKELTNEPITEEENWFIQEYGSYIGRIIVACLLSDSSDPYIMDQAWAMFPETEKSMAVIADVGTSEDECLEVGVGPVQEIYVIVPMQGKPQLTRGASFLYYEFIHPVRDRLTDEKWREMLEAGTAPSPPDWVLSFWSSEKKEEPKGKRREWRERYGHYYFSQPEKEYR